jgi:hypothetical protein
MTAPDWHAHAAQAAPTEPATEPTLALILPMPGTTLPAAAAPAAELPDSTDTALGARTAAELAMLTRVLLGLGVPAAAPAAPAVPVVPVVPVVPLATVADAEPLVPAFVAPPVVEVAPLVPLVSPEPAPLPEPEPVALEPEPETNRKNLLDELSFLDT